MKKPFIELYVGEEQNSFNINYIIRVEPRNVKDRENCNIYYEGNELPIEVRNSYSEVMKKFNDFYREEV